MASVPGVLDFIVPYILFNVQSATLAHPLWTSAYLNSASTSNPPCLLIPFGLPYAFPLLQCPICHACSSLLDFSIPFLRFNIQSTALAHPFWTSSCRISALTSNSPCIHLPHKRESNSSLRSGRRKAEVHRTSCAPIQKPGYAMFYPLIRLPLVHRKKGAKKLTLPHSLFPMDQRGVEPLSENPFPVLLLS